MPEIVTAWPSAVRLATQWVKTVPALTAIIGTTPDERVWITTPLNPTRPYLTVARTGGGPEILGPIDQAFMTFRSIAGRGDETPDWSSADDLHKALKTALLLVENVGVAEGHFYGAVILGEATEQDPETREAGYTLDALMTIRAE